MAPRRDRLALTAPLSRGRAAPGSGEFCNTSRVGRAHRDSARPPPDGEAYPPQAPLIPQNGHTRSKRGPRGSCHSPRPQLMWETEQGFWGLG